MKSLLSVFVTILALSGFGQHEGTSFFFSLDNLKDEETFQSFSEDEKGYYSISEASRRNLVVDSDSISVRSGFEIIISKKEAIKKGFTFEDDKMYGMAPYNGIHYKEINDTIVALYFQYDHYFGKNDLMIPGKKGYFLFTEEKEDLYSCEYISFDTDSIVIASIDHVEIMESINKLTKTSSKNIDTFKTFIASPSLKELEQLVKKDCFNDIRSYPKVEHL
ncbi:MAG: hypothetical protein H6599_07680 [Flavobacteriales bacterium]|nr:hypothetical protein [Flavobacteriales bacterium]